MEGVGVGVPPVIELLGMVILLPLLTLELMVTGVARGTPRSKVLPDEIDVIVIFNIAGANEKLEFLPSLKLTLPLA